MTERDSQTSVRKPDEEKNCSSIDCWTITAFQDMFASLRDEDVTTPTEVRMGCSPSKKALQEASVLRWGCTVSQIFFF